MIVSQSCHLRNISAIVAISDIAIVAISDLAMGGQCKIVTAH